MKITKKVPASIADIADKDRLVVDPNGRVVAGAAIRSDGGVYMTLANPGARSKVKLKASALPWLKTESGDVAAFTVHTTDRKYVVQIFEAPHTITGFYTRTVPADAGMYMPKPGETIRDNGDPNLKNGLTFLHSVMV